MIARGLQLRRGAAVVHGAAGARGIPRAQVALVWLLVSYLIGIAAAEGVAAFADPLAGALIDAVLVFLIINHYLLVMPSPAAPYGIRGDRDWSTPLPVLSAALAVLVLLPLLRLVSLAMPLTELPEILWPAAVGAPLLLAAILVMRALDLSPAQIGLHVPAWPEQLAIAAAGLPLGLVAFLVFPAQASSDGPIGRMALHALILVVFAAVLQELIFRGLIQRVLDGLLGYAGHVWSASLFTLVYLGSEAPQVIAFAASIGVLFGWCVRRTRSIVGVALAHGILLTSLVMMWPQVFGGAV